MEALLYVSLFWYSIQVEKRMKLMKIVKIVFQSIEYLCFYFCQFSEYHHTHIYAPSLVGLHLEAIVTPHQNCDDRCSNTYSGYCEDENCHGCHGMLGETGNDSANVCSWEDYQKLRTLIPNEWCIATDLWPLACILKQCPVLNKLTLRNSKNALVKSAAISEHLKVVKIVCKEADDGVYKIVKCFSTWKLLSKGGISRQNVNY
uniref:Uncharacterized protein n=1 Tax=Oryza barthii TaxID=65489 RepID=A0A0D3F4C2_9ORYZ